VYDADLGGESGRVCEWDIHETGRVRWIWCAVGNAIGAGRVCWDGMGSEYGVENGHEDSAMLRVVFL